MAVASDEKLHGSWKLGVSVQFPEAHLTVAGYAADSCEILVWRSMIVSQGIRWTMALVKSWCHEWLMLLSVQGPQKPRNRASDAGVPGKNERS
jgi:hypothetical protein